MLFSNQSFGPSRPGMTASVEGFLVTLGFILVLKAIVTVRTFILLLVLMSPANIGLEEGI
jgi:hypothetical protein